MGAQDKIERTLKQIHVLFSEGPIIAGNPDKVVVDKKEVFAILEQLNLAMYEMMDEYEMTTQARELAQRRSEKKGEELLSRISQQADDVYAASLIYTDNALNQVQKLMEEAMSASQSALRRLSAELDQERKRVKGDQRELQDQLRDFKESNKYLNIIDRYNRERQKKEREKQIKQGKKEPEKRIQNEAKHYALNEIPEIRVNPAYFERRRRKAETEEDQKSEQEIAEGKQKDSAADSAEQKQEDTTAGRAEQKQEDTTADSAEQKQEDTTAGRAEQKQEDTTAGRAEQKHEEAKAGGTPVNIEDLEGLLLLSLDEEGLHVAGGGEETYAAGEGEELRAAGEGADSDTSPELEADDSFDWNEIEIYDDAEEFHLGDAHTETADDDNALRLSVASGDDILPISSSAADNDVPRMPSYVEDDIPPMPSYIEDDIPPMPSSIENDEPEPFVMPEIKVDLDAEYFKWRAQKQEDKNGTDDAAEENAAGRKKERRFLFGKK